MTQNDVSNQTVTLHPVGPTAYDALMQELQNIQRRLVRIETRQVKTMTHQGVNPHKENEHEQNRY